MVCNRNNLESIQKERLEMTPIRLCRKTCPVGSHTETTKPDTPAGVSGFDPEWWWTQSGANSSPTISLFIRENTGNISEFGVYIGKINTQTIGILRLSSQIP